MKREGEPILLTAATLQTCGEPQFLSRLKTELLAQDALFAPLQQALTQGSYALLDDLSLLELRRWEEADHYLLRLGVQYRSAISGCACAGDPDPEIEPLEYAELELCIQRHSGIVSLQALAP